MRDDRHTVTFLSSVPVSRRDAATWGFARLKARGFDVEAVDLGAVLGSGFPPAEDGAAGDGWTVHRPAGLDELARLVHEKGRGVFVDFCSGLAEIGVREEPVYRVLSEACACYVVVYGGAVPSLPAGGRARGAATAARALRKAADPSRVRNLLVRRLVDARRGDGKRYSLPQRVFAGRSDALDSFVGRFPDVAGRVRPVNSFDFDTFLGLEESGFAPAQDGTILFIDEGLFSHPDWAYHRLEPVSPEEYARQMGEFLRALGERTGLRVRVAAHPRVPIETAVTAFPGFDVVQGSTIELVARASAVVTHASTAVSFATLFERPLLIVATRRMSASGYDLRVAATARALRLSPIVADDVDALAGLAVDPRDWPLADFAGYRDRYVIDPQAPRRNTWDIVADDLGQPA